MNYRLRPSEWVTLIAATAIIALLAWGLYEAGAVLIQEADLLRDRM